MSDPRTYDLMIVGGGINGVAIAADAAGRGLSVCLAEMSDLASATSSASSKLIHGGLRYLESYEFRLVREALSEREVLLAKAPHLIRPLRFVLPTLAGGRPRWMIRTGLFLYDHLARRRTIPGSAAINLAQEAAGRPLRTELRTGFTYWDCWVDDARLVILTAKAARAKGATILTRTRVTAASAGETWRIELADAAGHREIRARALVNAAGPWVDDVDRLSAPQGRIANRGHLRLVKGSHIVVPRIDGAEDAYLMQGADGRVVFVLPFEESFTIIGTTDIDYSGDPGTVAASPEEERYLLDLAGRFFKAPLSPQDIVWRYSGVRPLYDDSNGNPSAVTRDYHLALDAPSGAPPRLSVYGGKVTTHRRLAEEALALLAPHIGRPMSRPWTAHAPLPGGDMAGSDFTAFLSGLRSRFPRFAAADLIPLARRHGTLAAAVLGDAQTAADLGQSLGFGLTERELAFMKTDEWAETADDVLWRRSKVGLHALAAGSLETLRERVDILL